MFQGKIRALKGFVPPIELQKEFVAFVEQVDKSQFWGNDMQDQAEYYISNREFLEMICRIGQNTTYQIAIL